MTKKYELTEESIELDSVVLHRIRALKDINRYSVKAGDLGGYVESESNLSQDCDAWVFDDAKVYENACVFGNAKVSGESRVGGYAKVFGNAKVSGNACVFGNAKVSGDSWVRYSVTTTDITKNENTVDSIRVQTGLQAFNEYVIAFKHVREDLGSLYNSNFKYKVGEWIEEQNFDRSNESSASGLHVSNATYWEGKGGKKILMCKVMLEDIIVVGQGKIRCKRLFVMDATENEAIY